MKAVNTNRGGGGGAGKRGGEKTPPSKLVDPPMKDPRRFYFKIKCANFEDIDVDEPIENTMTILKDRLVKVVNTQLALHGNFKLKKNNGHLISAEEEKLRDIFNDIPESERGKRIELTIQWTEEGHPGQAPGYLGYTEPGTSKPGASK